MVTLLLISFIIGLEGERDEEEKEEDDAEEVEEVVSGDTDTVDDEEGIEDEEEKDVIPILSVPRLDKSYSEPDLDPETDSMLLFIVVVCPLHTFNTDITTLSCKGIPNASISSSNISTSCHIPTYSNIELDNIHV